MSISKREITELVVAVLLSTVSIIIGAVSSGSCNIRDANVNITVAHYLIVVGAVTLLGEVITAVELVHKKWPQEWLVSVVYHSKWFVLLVELFRYAWHIVGGIAIWGANYTISGPEKCRYIGVAFGIWALCIYHIVSKAIGLYLKFNNVDETNGTPAEPSESGTSSEVPRHAREPSESGTNSGFPRHAREPSDHIAVRIEE